MFVIQTPCDMEVSARTRHWPCVNEESGIATPNNPCQATEQRNRMAHPDLARGNI